MKKWKFSLGLPKWNWELGLVVLAFIFFIFLDASQNIAQASRPNFYAMTWWGLTAVASWWIFFTLYNVMLFVVFGRALRSRKTSYKFDVIFAIIGFLGLLLVCGAGIGAFYFGADEGIPYFLNIAQITVYHVGIFCQLITLLYFIITD